MFENARSAVIKGDYLTAVNLLEEVLKLQPTNQAAENLLGVARGGAKNASQLAVDAGNKAELTGDFLAARTQYELAQRLDPQSATAADAMRRLRGRMQTEGEEVFRRAQQFHTAGRDADAITNYEKALELLPPDHVQAKLARERVAELKSGASPR